MGEHPEVWADDRIVVPRRFSFPVEGPKGKLELEAAIEHGRVFCTRIERLPGGPPLGSELVRSLPLRELLDQAVRRVALGRAFEGIEPGTIAAEPLDDPSAVDALARRRRSLESREDRLKRVAKVYRQAEKDRSPSPDKAVAAALFVSPGRARNLVHEARQEGYLDPVPRSRRVGQKQSRKKKA
jgi:hypothetical protein